MIFRASSSSFLGSTFIANLNRSEATVESQLATMPGKDELRSMLLATLQAPLTQFVQQLNAPAQNFVYLLKAKEEKA